MCRHIKNMSRTWGIRNNSLSYYFSLRILDLLIQKLQQWFFCITWNLSMSDKNWFGGCKVILNALIEGIMKDENLCWSLPAVIRINFMSVIFHKCSMFRNKKKDSKLSGS